MTRRVTAALAVLPMLALVSRASLAVTQPCPPARNCAEVAVEGPSRSAAPGDTVLVRVAFQQGAGDQTPGGIDEIAALTMTLGIPGLGLADCSAPGPNGLNPSFVLLPGDPGRYRAVVQNLTCAGRTSCLCPASGEPRDDYINLLLVGTPAAAAVGLLPNGELLGIALRIPADADPHVPLHVYSAIDDPAILPRPPAAAWLSIGDGGAVDRTIDDSSDTLNVRVADGELTITGATPTAVATATATASATLTPPPACTGDCNGSGEITVNELIAGVRIVLGSLPLSTCMAFDCAGTGQVDVSCLIAGVNAALNGCPEHGSLSRQHGRLSREQGPLARRERAG